MAYWMKTTEATKYLGEIRPNWYFFRTDSAYFAEHKETKFTIKYTIPSINTTIKDKIGIVKKELIELVDNYEMTIKLNGLGL